MSETSVKQFNLPWHQHLSYWICLYAKSGAFAAPDAELLQKIGMQPLEGGGLGVKAPRLWKPVWDTVHTALEVAGMLQDTQAAVIGGVERPSGEPERRTLEEMDAIAGSLWLGEALLDGRLMCYLQPVVSAPDKIFGYESFARAKGIDGGVIAGDKIIAASRILGIEYAIDRHLHIQAIKTFVSSAFNGFLFVNFFPGFIQRPAVYLEGLIETAKSHGIVAKHIVLDFTKVESTSDIAHIKNICEYGRSRGYSIALDDIKTLEGAKRLLPDIRPDFVKIDMRLVHNAGSTANRDTIQRIVELTHAGGGAVIAEGVENEEMHAALRHLGADLFQGYLFSPPMPVEVVLRRSKGTA